MRRGRAVDLGMTRKYNMLEQPLLLVVTLLLMPGKTNRRNKEK